DVSSARISSEAGSTARATLSLHDALPICLAPADGYKESTRTPHSVFYYALGYTGWVGVILFAALQYAILAHLWRSYRLTGQAARSEEHTSELQSRENLVCRLLLEKKKREQ